MKQFFTFLVITVVALYAANAVAQSRSRAAGTTVTRQPVNYWHEVSSGAPSASLMPFHPRAYVSYRLDETELRAQMVSLSSDPQQGAIILLPLPDGTFRSFRVWQSSMMPDALAARYPDIKTFTGEAVDDGRITVKLDFTVFGFHAMIFQTDKTAFIDPYDHFHDGYYFAHYKKDEVRTFSQLMKCEVQSPDQVSPTHGVETQLLPQDLHADGHDAHRSAARTLNGWNLRTYRLALTADSFYCNAATGIVLPTITQAFSAMTTSMNRINGVYNREFSVQMNFCTNEDLLIFGCAGHTNGNDPFATIDNNGNACLTQNQTTATAIIGTANFDLGHVFTTGGGGVSSLGVVCNAGSKAQSCTGSPTPVGDGYDIDYVAHEMGHEYGSNHTFNNNADGSCSGNAVSSCAYEPGSGGTIMDYAGICNPDDLQYHSDPYFSASSLVQIVTKLNGAENACAVITSTGNHVDTLPHFIASYSIPYKTPFELIGPTSVDSTTIDSAKTYQWLQWNLGDFGKRLNQTYINGPIFRSFDPVYTTTRIFPNINMVLSGVLTNAGTEGAEGEKAPDTARHLTFKYVARGVISGYGCFHFPDDTIHLNAVQTPTKAGFKVTSQGTTGIVYLGGSTQTITWNVVGTDVAPVSAANVDIYVSTDGGFTWTYTVGTFPNTGTASVVLPNPATSSTTARIKVKGNGNVFFNINSNNFTLNNNPLTVGPINGAFSICQGATTTLTDGSSGGTWSSSNTAVATIVSGSGLLTGVSGGTSVISYVATGGTVTQVITVNPLPTVSAITGTATVCTGSTTPLTDATGGGTWNSGSPAVASVSAAGLVSGLTAGTSLISYSVSNTCGTTNATIVVTVNTGAVVAPISGTRNICQGATTPLSDVTAAGTWSSSNTTVATIGAGGLASGLTAGTTIISYSVSSGCGGSAVATLTVNALPVASISPAGTYTICAGGSALFTASSGAGYTFQWQNGAGNITGATGVTYTAIAADNYRVTITNANGCGATSAYVTVVVGSGFTVVPSVSISADPGITICTSGADTFFANPVNGGASPTYQWYVNGLTAGAGAAYTYVPASGDVVSVLLTSSASCALPDTASSTVVVTMSAPVTPSVSITSLHADTTCAGDTAQFAALPVYGGTAPTYLWTENGTNVATGPYYTYMPHDGDTLVLTMTSNHPCVTTNVVVSSIFIVHVFSPSVNNLSVFVTQSSIAQGSVDTFIAIASGAGSAPTFQWFIDGIAVPGVSGPMYITDTLQGGQMVSCKETSSFACSTPNTVTSGGISVSVAAAGVAQVGNGINSLTLSPNPSGGSFTIKGSLRSGADEHVDIAVTDMLGQTVYKETAAVSNGKVNAQLNLSSIVPNGIYLVSVTAGEGHVVFHVVIDK